MARLALYLRRSDPGEENKNYSIEDQRNYLTQEWPEFAQHELVAEYSDPGGKSYTLNRPVLMRLMEAARAREFDLLAVWKYDRLSRVQDQQAVTCYQLDQYGVKVVSATEPIADGATGTLMRNLYAFGAEQMLYRIREGTYRGKKARVKAGKLPGAGVPLYGYEWKDDTKGAYVVDEQIAWVIRRIFAQVLAGYTLRYVSEHLTADGVPTPSAYHLSRGWRTPQSGRPAPKWSHATVHNVLANPAYSGRYVGFRTQKQTVMQVHPVTGENMPVDRYVIRDEDHPDRVVFGADVCPPIVSEADFDAVRVILAQNKANSARNIHRVEGALLRNGFARCGYCGSPMSAIWATDRGEKYLYRCSRANGERANCPIGKFTRLADDMDAMMWRAVIAVFERPDVVRAKYEEYKADKAQGLTIEQDRFQILQTMLQEAEKKRRLNTSLASNEEDDDQRAEYQRIGTEAARSIKGSPKR